MPRGAVTLAAIPSGANRGWVLGALRRGLGGKVPSVADAAEFGVRRGFDPVALVLAGALGIDGFPDDLVKALAGAALADVHWLVGLAGRADRAVRFEPLCTAIKAGVPLGSAKRVVDLLELGGELPSNASGPFAPAALVPELIRLMGLHPARLGEVPLCIQEAHRRNSIGFVEVWLESPFLMEDTKDEQFLIVHAEALLRAGAAGLVNTTDAQDVSFAGGESWGLANGRTGFLTLTVPGRAPFDVHTHWDDSAPGKGLTSAHIQQGRHIIAGDSRRDRTINGFEVTAKEYRAVFRTLIRAMTAAHNTQRGARGLLAL